MEMMKELMILVLGFVLLIKGADWFVDGASGIAARFGIPQLVIGLTIVAMGTSAPEAAVSITAAMKGSAGITIGNVVGSNILNIWVILGISSLLSILAVARSTVRVEIPFMMLVTAVLLAEGWDGTIGFLDGVCLWLLFLAYLGYLFVLARKNREEQVGGSEILPLPKALGFTVLGLAMIILGSDFTVDGASAVARLLGLSERFIGLTIVALGTSLPELFTSVNAARKHNADIAIGNIVGSNIFNILFVVGTCSLIIPVPMAAAFRIDILTALAAAAMLLVCCLPRRKLGRHSGLLMLLAYVLYFAVICF